VAAIDITSERYVHQQQILLFPLKARIFHAFPLDAHEGRLSDVTVHILLLFHYPLFFSDKSRLGWSVSTVVPKTL